MGRVVLVCGGGGAKAIAHAGAWKALGEAGVAPDQVVGTSFGAVIAAALAGGASYDEVVIAARSLSRKDVAPLDPLAFLKGMFASSLLKADGLRRAIARLVPAKRFADLLLPLTVTATDLDSGELVLFGAGGRDAPLADALYASCALPLYYPAARLNGRRLGDGGLRAVLPLEVAARFTATLVVAIHVGPGFDETLPPDRRTAVPPLIRAHGEAERIMMAAQVERQIASWPTDGARLVVVRAVAEREATFAVEEVDRYVQAGYRETKRALASTLDA